jgi:hypothetical protein
VVGRGWGGFEIFRGARGVFGLGESLESGLVPGVRTVCRGFDVASEA